MSLSFKEYSKNTASFWDTCDETFAHLHINRWLGSYESITEYWDSKFLKYLELKDMEVVEYGIGGGYLGKYLLEKKSIKKYIGIDISDRSIEASKKTLSNFKDIVHFYKSDIKFSNLGGDIFISQACIQHFPSKEYFVSFLENLNETNFKHIVLQYRYSSNTFHVSDNPMLSLFTNSEFILSYLKNFKLTQRTSVEDNGYQFIILSRSEMAVPSVDGNNIEIGFYETNYFKVRLQLKELQAKCEESQKISFVEKLIRRVKKTLL